MQPGDILYSNVCTRPLVVMVRRGDGEFFDFAAAAFAAPSMPFDVRRFTLAMMPDATFPTTQRCVIPVAATMDPQAELIEALAMGTSGTPQPTQSFWISVNATSDITGVLFSLARGCVGRFAG